MTVKRRLAEVAGWYGAAAILGAYALVSLELVTATSFWFQFLNLTGAFGLMVISLVKRVAQEVILNFIWILIAVYAIVKIAF